MEGVFVGQVRAGRGQYLRTEAGTGLLWDVGQDPGGDPAAAPRVESTEACVGPIG